MEKKSILALLILWSFFIAGCTSPAVNGTYIKKTLPEKSAILIDSDNVLSDALMGELIKRGYAVITKDDVKRALSGKAVALSGLSEQSDPVQIGKRLQANAVMTIKMFPFSWEEHTVYTAIIKLFDTEQGSLIGSATYQNGTAWISREPLPNSAERIAKQLFEGAN
ncbi:MAG: hypothetical protein HY742_07185 [Deltaproteobacteria bacterium]|nr:hypothetical protein [Deltaproteobacteria bacterium]